MTYLIHHPHEPDGVNKIINQFAVVLFQARTEIASYKFCAINNEIGVFQSSPMAPAQDPI